MTDEVNEPEDDQIAVDQVVEDEDEELDDEDCLTSAPMGPIRVIC